MVAGNRSGSRINVGTATPHRPFLMNSDNQSHHDWLAMLDHRASHHRCRLKSGLTISWRAFGAGPKLILLHGGHGNWKHWARNIDALSARYAVWLPDMPGFGESDDLQSPHDFDGLVDAMLESMDILFGPDESIGLAGFSFGGLVAAHVASQRRVSALALLGSAGHGGARRAYSPLRNWRDATTRPERLDALEHNLKALMLSGGTAADPLGMAIYEDACANARFRSKHPSTTGKLSRNLLEVLCNVNAPLLLIWGGEDVTASNPAQFADQLGHVSVSYDLAIVQGAGHWAQYEKPDDINRLLLHWFDNEKRH
jgi:2-hydroxy-6-oxonona-2,4-dienedioate hydrolase